MKHLLIILFVGLISLTHSFGQINQNSNPAAIGIDAFSIGLGQTGDLDVAVENNGSDPMPPGTFRVYIGIDPTKMEFVNPASYISINYPDWTVVSVSASQLVLVNSNGEISPSENATFQIKVLAKADAPKGESNLSLRVGIAPGQGANAGNADNSAADDTAPGIVVLPVTLVSFTAAKESRTTLLNWSTTEETNSDRFEIERSANGKNWNKIGTVASNGESKVLRNYGFTDASPLHGENLYRLRMVDKDNSFAYSRIRSIGFEAIGSVVSVYPNPATDRLFIPNFDKVKEIVINDLSGRQVNVLNLSTSVPVPSGQIDVKNLVAGMYVIKVRNLDGTQYTQKFVVQK